MISLKNYFEKAFQKYFIEPLHFYYYISGPHWLKNLFFTYLLTLRAVVKAAPYWKQVNFYTGDLKEDNEVKKIVLEMVNTAK